MQPILQWIDLVWPPIAWAVASRKQRFVTVATVFACMAMMRLMVELMESIGYPHGLIGLVPMPVLSRGLLVYSIFYMLYLFFVHYSKRSGALLLGGSLMIFFGAALTFSVFMVL